MLRGTEITVDQLIALRPGPGQAIAPRAFARQVGQRESRLAGTGLQMRELRHYQPGDDLRHVHWKATARLGEPLTKVFEAEHELSWLLVLALTPGMYFGSQQAYKSVRALEAAALLAWERLAVNDAVGSLICSPHGLSTHSPTRTRAGLLRQLSEWSRHSKFPPPMTTANQNDQTETLLATLQLELQALCRPHRPLVIFSDFLPPGGWQSILTQIAPFPATLVQLYDPLEQAPPTQGRYPVSGPQGTHWIQGSAATAERYQNARADWFQALHTTAAQGRNRWVTLGTEQDPAQWSWVHQEVRLGS